MNHRATVLWGPVVFGGLLMACTQQDVSSVKPAIVAKLPSTPVVVAPTPPKVAVKKTAVSKSVANVPEILPVPVPYEDIVLVPKSLLPVPKPIVSPAPVIKPVVAMPTPVPMPVVPKVKVKGVYHGAIPVANSLRQQYQQQ